MMKAVIGEVNIILEKVEKMEMDTNINMEKTANTQQNTNPRYIENPLPLPKKHVAKEMDYQYTVEEKDMKYDVEVSEDDDFDIQ